MGKVARFEIVFSSEEATYVSGRNITGHVVLDLVEAIKVTKIRMRCLGKAKVRWFNNSAMSDGSDPVYRSEEIYIDESICLYESGGRDGDYIPKGSHKYPFNIQLPANIPCSFEGEFGYIRYTCSSIIDRQGFIKSSHHHEKTLSVVRPLDLNNEISELRTPLVGEEAMPVMCCCCISGLVTARIHMHRTAFVPGENISWKVEVRQDTTATVIKSCSIILKQFVEYIGLSDAFFSSGIPKPHVQSNPVCSRYRGGVKAGELLLWEDHMEVPALPPSRLDGCEIISVTYALRLKVLNSFGEDIVIVTDILIGTIPLVDHFRPPPYSEACSMQSPLSATLALTLPPVVDWNIPPPSYEECMMSQPQRKLPDSEDERLEDPVNFTPRYPCYRNQPLFTSWKLGHK